MEPEFGDGPLESTSESFSMGLHLTESVIAGREYTRDTECQTSDCEEEDESDSTGHTKETRYWDNLKLHMIFLSTFEISARTMSLMKEGKTLGLNTQREQGGGKIESFMQVSFLLLKFQLQLSGCMQLPPQ